MKNRFGRLSESRKLEMLQLSVEDIYNQAFLDGHVEGYEHGELNERRGYGSIKKEKSPNQQRAELIQRAREFVVKHQAVRRGQEDNETSAGNITAREHFYETEFRVKSNKVTAVVYLLLIGKERARNPQHIGRANCHPDEVFNADIGKAISLARALEIEVPQEFLQAVQPTEVVVGMKVKSRYTGFDKYYERTIVEMNETEVRYEEGGFDFIQKVESNEFSILDDTNAQYGESVT